MTLLAKSSLSIKALFFISLISLYSLFPLYAQRSANLRQDIQQYRQNNQQNNPQNNQQNPPQGYAPAPNQQPTPQYSSQGTVYSQTSAPAYVPVGPPQNIAVDSTGGGFASPGITALKNDQWIGSDNLYNMTNNIGIIVEIDGAFGITLPINAQAIKSHISDLFERGGLIPQAEGGGSVAPPLPFFHLLIMAYPVEKSMAAFISGRLFEQVTLQRIVLEKGIFWQAITWERQELIVADKSQFVDQVNRSVDEIVNAFIARWKYFQNLKPPTTR